MENQEQMKKIKQIQAFLKKKKYGNLENYIQTENCLNLAIQQMQTNKHSQRAIKWIQKYNLDIEDYPELLERAAKKYVRYIQMSKDIFQGELQICQDKNLLAIMAEDLFYYGNVDQALTLVYRYDLVSSLKKIEIIGALNQNYKEVINPMIQNDAFLPTEMILDKNADFIKLQDFNITEKSLKIIETEKQLQDLYQSLVEKKGVKVYQKDWIRYGEPTRVHSYFKIKS